MHRFCNSFNCQSIVIYRWENAAADEMKTVAITDFYTNIE